MSASGLASSTVCKAHVVLSGILELGIRTKRIASNPAAGIRLPRQEVAKRRYLSPSEVQALAEAAGPHSLIVYVLAMTGLRIGELAALTVGSVDLGRRRLMVDRSFTEVHGEGKFSVPKSGERRSVPFPSILDEAMRRQMNMRPRDALLFPSPNGATLRVRNMRRSWFDRAAEEAGLEGLTPHELRHTAASLAVSSGASVLAVQRMLGHEKPSTTLDVYTDLFDADLDAVADGIATSFKDFGTFLVRPE
nr:site-specific integrase [Helcobacillus sp. ACRRO]